MTERREFTPEDPAVHSITWDEAYSMTPRENDSMEVSDSLVEELGGHFQSQHYYLHCEVCGESWPCRMQRAATRIESLQETLTQMTNKIMHPSELLHSSEKPAEASADANSNGDANHNGCEQPSPAAPQPTEPAMKDESSQP